MITDNDTQFMERALLATFFQGRHLGLGNTYTGDNWTAATAISGGKASDDDDRENDEGWGVVGRLTTTPYRNGSNLIYLGVASNYRKLRSDRSVRFKSGPESHLGGLSLVDTGKTAIMDASNLTFDGWYAQMGYVLTGESRPYKGNKFGRSIQYG